MSKSISNIQADVWQYVFTIMNNHHIDSQYVFVFYEICRYELPGINALNFVLKNSLGGGGVASLRSDPQVGITIQL